MVYAFIFNDFSVIYVAANSNSQLPVYFRMAAVWGAHEGSLLLWIVLLSLWTGAVAAFSRQMPLEAVARVLSVLGMINVGFLLFVILTSNPFLRALPMIPIDGRDLNPLLQDVGLIFHPPLLYMGYVGFSVAFAFAISSLMAGKLDTVWARWSRPWTTAAWVFLTLGIALGSYWAYYELGWGGWWFWDPVENASLMPWITGTALLHSLAVTEKRGSFKAWTVLMAIVSFSLCLLGTLWCVPAFWFPCTRLLLTPLAACLFWHFWWWLSAALCCCMPSTAVRCEKPAPTMSFSPANLSCWVTTYC